ncbi:MAG: phosphate ABC transporter substrate-binding protein [Coriobacteriia bacterium]|nr:phosphate ABC transporter substrate-binding protein [Coriobacteriia bacterium]
MRWNHRSVYAFMGAFILAFGLSGLAGCATETTEEAPVSQEESVADITSSLDAFAGLEGDLDIAGGTAHIPVMEALAADIMSANDAIAITVAGGGSGVGVQQIGEGLVEIGNSGRELKDDEIAKYPGLELHAWAIDGVTAIVHPDNPVQELTADQVKAIFAGEITDWSEVGGNSGAINVYAREEGSGTGETFIEKGLGNGDVSERAVIVTSNGAMKTSVAADAAAIGFMSIGGVDDSVAAVSYDNVEPTNENALNGSYVVTRKLYSVTQGTPEGLTAVFLEYLMGENGVTYIEDAGYIPTYAR